MRARAKRMPRPSVAVGIALLAAMVQAAAFVETDDAGHAVSFERPARRVITLAPSLTELVFAAGGGDAVVAADSSSNYPGAMHAIPRIGDASRLDVERIVALKPDLVVVWRHGNTNRELDQLEAAGLRLFRLEPQRLDEVVLAIERLGRVIAHCSLMAAQAKSAGQGSQRVGFIIDDQQVCFL